MVSEWLPLVGVMATNTAVSVGLIKYINDKIGRVYGRLDEVKGKLCDEFVRRETCNIQHTNNSNNLTGLEVRINNRLDKLEQTVSDQYAMLIKIMTEKK